MYREPSRNGVYKPPQFHGSGARIVNMGELFANRFIGPQEMNRLRLSDTELQTFGLSAGDLLFGRRSLVESGAGKCSLVVDLPEPTTFESSLIRVRVDERLVDPRFLFYWFSSRHGRGSIRAIVSGTNVKGIRGSDLRNVAVPIPDARTQGRIVQTLRAYDDLIENNRRRIKLLEEAARLIYREWFVRLRFPGYEHAKIVNGVPAGWTKGTVSDFYETTSGGTPSRGVPEYYDGDINWVKTQELTGGFIFETSERITREGLRHSAAKLLPEGTLLVAMYGATIGRTGLLANASACNQACAALAPRDSRASTIYAHLYFEDSVDQLNAVSQGAAQRNVSQRIIQTLPMLLPSADIGRGFADVVQPLYSLRRNLEQAQAVLARARDLLLPRLMSGEVEV